MNFPFKNLASSLTAHTVASPGRAAILHQPDYPAPLICNSPSSLAKPGVSTGILADISESKVAGCRFITTKFGCSHATYS